jgi:glycosyltransferase involved in cell wall biosynthesis
MKITYTGPNRSHDYGYAQALYNANVLYAFISGFSRLSSRAKLINVGNTLRRHDFFQTQYIGSLKLGLPTVICNMFNRLSNLRLDRVSYKAASKSDVFIFYRTQGLSTTRRIHKQKGRTICVMLEVNSHVENAREILYAEYKQLNINKPFEDEPDYKLRLEAYDEVDYILCPSEFVRNSFLRKGFAPEKLIKVNFGFPKLMTSGTDKKYNLGDPFRVLYVGQLHYRKGLHYAIEAFKKLQHPNKEFIIVGPQTTITGLEKTVIPNGVVLMGTLKGEELNDQYRRASCFILPSLEEGLALVQTEALSFGLPLLTTTNSGGDDIISDGIQGFIVPPCDAEALRQRLQQMADSPEMLTRMSAAATLTAQTLDGWDAAGNRLVKILAEAIAKKPALPIN